MADLMPSKGSRVWVQRGAEGWRRGTVVGPEPSGGLRVVLDCDQLGEAAGPEVTAPLAAVEPANPALLDGVRCVRGSGWPARLLPLVTTRLHKLSCGVRLQLAGAQPVA